MNCETPLKKYLRIERRKQLKKKRKKGWRKGLKKRGYIIDYFIEKSTERLF